MPSPYGTGDVFRLGYGPPTSAIWSILELSLTYNADPAMAEA
jgi:hypothetical protein